MPKTNLMTLVTASVLCLLFAGADTSAEFQIDSAQLTLLEVAEVSASEAGLLSQLMAKEGATVAEGEALAELDDREAKLVRDRAETEVQLARALAGNDITVRYAKLSAAVAAAELKRALESNVKFPKSVSETEIDRLKLLADKAMLEIEQAGLDLQQAQLSLQTKQHDLTRAKLALERRTIVAPFPGMVVQSKKQPGEWVEPGTPVIRLVRLNRLRAEAFVASERLPANLVGRAATLVVESSDKTVVKHPGKLVFVSPEIDPVNYQVRIWAEIDNSDLSLRPGQTATLLIGPATEGASK
jgi:multidrug efflux pump subunit AcrA (membrane-fusion protein)